MTIPGPVITERDAATPRGSATDTGVWFVALPAERGPIEPTSITSPDAFARIYGARVSYSIASDAVAAAFGEGVQRIVFARVVGPAAVKASKVLKDATNADSIRVEGIGPDTYSNGLKVAVVAGASAGTFVIVVSDSSDVELERSPDLADVNTAVLWGSSSDYVRVVVLGAANPAVAAAAALTGGADDRASITDASYKAALDRFVDDFGPGQVSIPGRASGTAHADLVAHASAHNRRAYLDVAQTDTSKSQLKTVALAVRALTGSDAAGVFGPWAIIPGVVPGTVREVPYSAIAAGQAARVDALGNPNVAAAGVNGVSAIAIGVKGSTFTAAERGELNDAGLNLARFLPNAGTVVTYGFRTAADPLKWPLKWQLANRRLDMAIAARANAIAETYVFAQLDSITVNRFGGDLGTMLTSFFLRGALFGSTPDEAFSVDVGPTVNPPEALARGELRAVIAVKRSAMAERVIVEVVKVALDAAV